MKRSWLIGLAVLGILAAGVVLVQAEGHTFVGAEKCKMCHKIQFTSWQETGHAKATEKAKASTERTFSADCLKCHATNSDEKLPGVQCEACHGAGSDYKTMTIMKDHAQAVAAGLTEMGQAVCDTCHTGADHAKKVVFAEAKTNLQAIHKHKGQQ